MNSLKVYQDYINSSIKDLENEARMKYLGHEYTDSHYRQCKIIKIEYDHDFGYLAATISVLKFTFRKNLFTVPGIKWI